MSFKRPVRRQAFFSEPKGFGLAGGGASEREVLEEDRTKRTAGNALSGERSNRCEENPASQVHRTPKGAGY